MIVKQAEIALEDLRRGHENWKKNAEAINVEISKNISKVQQRRTNEASQRVLKRSPLLTALAEVNLQIFDGLQEGIPDVNLDSPREKETQEASFDFPKQDSGNTADSQYSEDSQCSKDSADSVESGVSDEFRFEIIEDDEGETWVELCKPPQLGGKS